MLENAYQQQRAQLLNNIECRIELPDEWKDFFSQHGIMWASYTHRRRFVRAHHRDKSILELDQTLAVIQRQHQYYCVYSKDVSRSGIGFLHAEQLFPGERPVLWLSSRKIRCIVARCVRHNAHCFEIGATFDDDE